jgi:ABC-2 type transport system ATP-binding protein
MEHIVEINDLSKDYETGFWRKKRVRALDDLSLKVARGQIFGFLGGNGAGKTTTIKILMGLLFPTSGNAKVLGCDIADVRMHNAIGYCPENPYFYDYLTASELLNYFGGLFGLAPSLRRSRAEELLTRVGLDEKDWHRQLRKFSKGMLQRVGLAQALINDPEIVFLDEPMSGLDPLGRREIKELIASLRDQGKTVFMSTHILSDVEALCDEIAILRKGRLATSGRLSDLLAQADGKPAFEISAGSITADDVSGRLRAFADLEIRQHPSGITVRGIDEKDVEAAVRIVLDANGDLISVLPMQRRLEDIFAEPEKAPDNTAHT